MTKCQYAFCCQSVLKGAGKRAYSVSGISYRLKCYYDQILDIHFFTFSHTIGVSKISCQISIYHEQQNSCFLDLYFREFTAAINFPCSKSGLRIGENDVIFSNSPVRIRITKALAHKFVQFSTLIVIIISTRAVFLRK